MSTSLDNRTTSEHASWQETEISLARLGAIILRGRKSIVRAAVGLSAFVLIVSLVLPRKWTATATFVPQGDQLQVSGSLASLAGQFGVNLGAPSASAPGPQFYVELAKSREVLGALAGRSYAVEDTLRFFFKSSRIATIADLMRIEPRKPHLQSFAAAEWLREEGVSATASMDVGVVRISASTKWPDLSLALVTGIIEELTRFNLETRQSEAAAERKFVGERMESAEAELRSAERELQDFLRSNRAFQSSPELLFEHDRLQRNVQMRQGVYTALAQSFEQSRISEVRNTPVITIVEPPAVPPEPDKIFLIFRLIAALVIGALGGAAWVLVSQHFNDSTSSRSRDVSELLSAWSEISWLRRRASNDG